MERLGTDETFLDALQYPLIAIPEYWIQKQKESGWSREIYLGLLKGQHGVHLMDLHLMMNKAKAKDVTMSKDKIGKPLIELTNGKVIRAYTLHNNSTTILNSELLETLSFCLQQAYSLGKPLPTYTDLQIISFARQSMYWIKNELKLQSDPSNISSRNIHWPPNRNADGEKMYLLYNYSLMLPSPAFDYFLFEDALRNVLLNSTNPDNLKQMTKALSELSKEIVNFWNDEFHKLESDFDVQKQTVTKTRQFIEFDVEKRWFKIWINGKIFVKYANKNFYNYDLVNFASRVGSVVDREVFGIEGESLKPNKANPQTLSELFYTEKDYLVSIEALRTIKAIDEANQNIIGYTLKGVMQVWIDILRNERGCLKQVNDALLTILLNKEFPGLNLGEKSEGRHFRNPINKTAKARYRPKLLALIRE